jgi:glycerophosphoryl diester phosphodiesterase
MPTATPRSAPAPRHPFLDHPGPIAFAHRGGAREGVGENSLAAFAHAVAIGYRYLETDVHATADGVLLAFHDRRLGRLTDTRGRIADMAHADVAAARIGGTEDAVPTMAELLDAFPGARWNIDVKEPNAIRPLAELLRTTPGAVDRVCVSSFSDKRLAAMRREIGPGLCTSAGPREAYRLWRASRNGKNGKNGQNGQNGDDGMSGTTALPRLAATCLQLPPRVGRISVVDEKLIAAAHRLGLPVHVWTIDDPAEMHRLLDLGADGLMTDRVDVLKAVLTERGTWS